MKKAYLLLSVLIVLAACIRQQGSRETVPSESAASQLVDKPAVVFFPGKSLSGNKASNKRKLSAEKILGSFNIPLIESESSTLEFLKSNGERIKLDVIRLGNRYDLILFNAVNDPMPCRLRDLKKAAASCFIPGTKLVYARHKVQLQLQNPENPVPDTLLNSRAEGRMHGYAGKRKTLVLPVDCSACLPQALRNDPGINWVEQRIETRSQLKLTFENDLITYNNTDRYFTNGITFELQAPWLGRLRMSSLMPAYAHPSQAGYSMLLVQNMYTPTDTRIAPSLHNDRPYASYLYLGYSKVITDPLRKIRLHAEADLGYLGPYSPGSYLQTLVHSSFPTNDKPLGWETQIRTAVILNYDLKIEKAVVDHKAFLLAASASAKAGTLYTQAGAGFRLQAGKQSAYFGQQAATAASRWQYYFFLKAEGNFIGYDATLEGGMLSHHEIFKLGSTEITHWVGSAEGGLYLLYKGNGIEIAQHYLSPEYKGGLWHKWGRISLLFRL